MQYLLVYIGGAAALTIQTKTSVEFERAQQQ